MCATIDPVHVGRDQTVPPLTEAQGARAPHGCPARKGGLL
jgi:hypothetical protein